MFVNKILYFVESEYKNQIQDPTKEGTVCDVELYSNFKTIAESIPETSVLLYNDSGRPGQARQGFVKTMTEAGLL